ncbi:pyridoxamine 5'-phosphate oxidase family protein [Paenibacillus xanthanilyticus]|uniref:Pyridoxamine 5'-phosphate oxidase N-terminal domain-containing protein n=1 Tax=Paenibacillus xanthanilyticus TaxID=1783531 RepID=A0ABV8K3X9_9BACL
METTLAKLVSGPIIGHLGTCDAEGRMSSDIFCSAELHEDPDRLVIHIGDAALEDVRRNIAENNYGAAILADVLTYESIQIKGPLTLRPATEEERQLNRMRVQTLADLGYPERLQTMSSDPLTAIEILVQEVYSQTPGVGAGEPILILKGV